MPSLQLELSEELLYLKNNFTKERYTWLKSLTKDTPPSSKVLVALGYTMALKDQKIYTGAIVRILQDMIKEYK